MAKSNVAPSPPAAAHLHEIATRLEEAAGILHGVLESTLMEDSRVGLVPAPKKAEGTVFA